MKRHIGSPCHPASLRLLHEMVLCASEPLITNKALSFPISKATNSSQFTRDIAKFGIKVPPLQIPSVLGKSGRFVSLQIQLLGIRVDPVRESV